MKGHGLGPINAALYKIASNPAKYAADFYDVATGNDNQVDPSVPGYPATQGLGSGDGPGDAERGEPASRPGRPGSVAVS